MPGLQIAALRQKIELTKKAKAANKRRDKYLPKAAPPIAIEDVAMTVAQLEALSHQEIAVEMYGALLEIQDMKADTRMLEMELLLRMLRDGNDNSARQRRDKLVTLAVSLMVFLAIGTALFSVVCGTPLQTPVKCRDEDLKGCEWSALTLDTCKNCVERACYGFAYDSTNDWWSALYLALVTFTTIGYGDVYPESGDAVTIMIMFVLIVLGVIAYSLSVVIDDGESEGSASVFTRESILEEYEMGVAASQAELKNEALTAKSAEEVDGDQSKSQGLDGDFSKEQLGPRPNVLREVGKLILALLVLTSALFLLAYMLKAYIGWSFVASLYFTWYTATTIGYGDYGGFECKNPTLFTTTHAWNGERVPGGWLINGTKAAGTCRTPDADPFAKFLVMVVIMATILIMSAVLSALQTLGNTSLALVSWNVQKKSIEDSMRRLAFSVVYDNFDSIDADGSGEIDIEELQAYLSVKGMSDIDIRKLAKEFDSDNSGTIERGEVAIKVQKLQKAKYAGLLERFNELDVDKRGWLSVDQLGKLMPAGTPRDEIKSLMEELDADGDGKLDLHELMALADTTGSSETETVQRKAKVWQLLRPWLSLLLALVGREIFVHASAGIWTAIGEWSYLDSLYFVVVTISTVGFGDFSPQTDGARIFCMIWGTIGIGINVLCIDAFSKALDFALLPFTIWLGTLLREALDLATVQKSRQRPMKWKSIAMVKEAFNCAATKKERGDEEAEEMGEEEKEEAIRDCFATRPKARKALNLIRKAFTIILPRDAEESGQALRMMVMCCVTFATWYINAKIFDALEDKLIPQRENYVMISFMTTIGFGDGVNVAISDGQKLYLYLTAVPMHTVTTTFLLQFAEQMVRVVSATRAIGQREGQEMFKYTFERAAQTIAAKRTYEPGSYARQFLRKSERQIEQDRGARERVADKYQGNSAGGKRKFHREPTFVRINPTLEPMVVEDKALATLRRTVSGFTTSSSLVTHTIAGESGKIAVKVVPQPTPAGSGLRSPLRAYAADDTVAGGSAVGTEGFTMGAAFASMGASYFAGNKVTEGGGDPSENPLWRKKARTLEI